MKFGPVATEKAEGAVLAHSVTAGGKRLRKGLVLTAAHVATLLGDGIAQITVARLDPDDIGENTAAGQLAAALVPDATAAGLRITTPFTGRVNLIADHPGVVCLDVAALERFNRVHPMITIATVPPFQQMQPGGMVATIKIISYAVPGADVTRAAASAPAALHLARRVLRSAGLVITDIPGGPPNDKGIRAITGRLTALGIELAETRSVEHRADALAGAVQQVAGDMVLILTGSATSDPNDVAPSALRLAGGQVQRFGMPVDPGNLLFLGQLGSRPVIGLPGCARSPALNGADWVLSRVACGLEVSGDDIAGMGVGGLLKEIPTRPQPRAPRQL
ncbi:MAG: molybdenum cofactor cytidylyltransferase [Paracoccaceae bacterium]